MEERSEKPSLRKLRKAREGGDVPKSSELAFACIFLCSLLLIKGLSSLFGRGFKELFLSAYQFRSVVDPIMCLRGAFGLLIYQTLIAMVVIFLVALFAHLLQTGWVWSWSRSGGKEHGRWMMLLLKLGIIASLCYFDLSNARPYHTLIFAPDSEKIAVIFHTVFSLLLKIGIALFLLGLCDFMYQKWKYYKRMHMTPQEVKEEERETGGGKMKGKG